MILAPNFCVLISFMKWLWTLMTCLKLWKNVRFFVLFWNHCPAHHHLSVSLLYRLSTRHYWWVTGVAYIFYFFFEPFSFYSRSAQQAMVAASGSAAGYGGAYAAAGKSFVLFVYLLLGVLTFLLLLSMVVCSKNIPLATFYVVCLFSLCCSLLFMCSYYAVTHHTVSCLSYLPYYHFFRKGREKGGLRMG